MCWRAGRRVAEAYLCAKTKLQCGVDESRTWSVLKFGSVHLLQQARGVILYIYGQALIHLDYLDTLPLLLARLREPGVKARCFEQFAQGLADDHSDVSKRFLAPGSEFCAHVQAVTRTRTPQLRLFRMGAIPPASHRRSYGLR